MTQWMTRDEAAKALEVQPGTVSHYARTGRLTRYYVQGNRPRYKREDVEALARELAPHPEQP